MRLLLVTALLLGTTGCAAFSDDAAADGKVSVAAAFYPLAFVAQRVGGDDVAVTNLTQPGNEPHDLELDIKTTAEVADADLVLLEHGFQPAVDDAVAEVAEGDVLDVADVVDLKDSTEDAGEKDPHFWQDPARMATLTESVAASLSKVDPDHAATYDANAQALVADLDQLGTRLRAGAAGLRAGHDRGVARRVHLPRPVRAEGRGDRRPLPRRRADAGRPGPAAGADRDGRDHHRVLRAAGQPAAERRPWPTTWGSPPPCSTPSRG